MPTATTVTLAETGTRLGEQTAGQTSRRQVTIIKAGWGSSGYYSQALLERDGPTAFPVGTQMYLDHPGRTEESDRPERSVRDLAARLATTPQMVGDELVAEADIFDVWRPVIDSLANDIGLSIRALGETESGEVDGRTGQIVTALTEGISVDFVTRAGAGGRVGQLIESAREQLAETLQSDVVAQLDNAGKERWGGRGIYVYVDDYDPDEHWAVYSICPDGGDRAFVKVAYEMNDSALTLAFDTQEVRRTTAYEPVAATAVHEAAAGRGKEVPMSDTDTRLAQLEETSRQQQTQIETVTTELEETKKDRDAASTRADRAEDKLERIDAEKIVREAVDKIDQLPARATERAVKEALGEKLPVDDDGKLDTAKLTERATKAAEAERDYLAEAAPTGRVQGFGPSGRTETDGADEKNLAEAFGRLGMNDDQAKLAAAGR